MVRLILKYNDTRKKTEASNFGDEDLSRAEVVLTGDVCKVKLRVGASKEIITFGADQMKIDTAWGDTVSVIPFGDASFHAIFEEIMSIDELFSGNQHVGISWFPTIRKLTIYISRVFPEGEHRRHMTFFECQGGRARIGRSL